MFKESGRQTNEITFFFFDDEGTSNQRGKRGGVWGEYEGGKVLQDPSLVHKSHDTGASLQNKDTAAHSQKQEKERAKTIKE